MLVLRLNKAGMPQEWIDVEQAAKLYSQDKVLFELGSDAITLKSGKVALTNRYLFRRDSYLCMYCGNKFTPKQLTRDHIIPRSRGGKDSWTRFYLMNRRILADQMAFLQGHFTSHREWTCLE